MIDKILARYKPQWYFPNNFCPRYSAEFTIYREVLQNANDAGANTVEIVFESDTSSKETAEGNNIASVCLRNNGRPFNADDWGRLKKIAEGNPDEQKVFLSLAFLFNGA